MSNLTEAIAILKHSPRLPDVVKELLGLLRAEADRRQHFYEWLNEDLKAEFIDGEVVLHSPVRNAHMTATINLSFLILAWIRRRKLGEVKVEKCLCVFPRNDYEPDIAFFNAEKASQFTADTMKFPVPDFIVEVLSESTEKRDRGIKFDDYEAHGVREYWIIDTFTQVVEQYILRHGKFVLNLQSSDAVFTSEVITGFQIPIRAIFDDRVNDEALNALMNA